MITTQEFLSRISSWLPLHSAVCSPSRASLMTGRHPQSVGLYPGVLFADSLQGGDHWCRSIYNGKRLSVCLSRKMITLPNGLKSSSLAVVVSFFKHCYNKMFSTNCTCQQKFVFELLIFSKYIFNFAKNRGKKGKSTEKVMKRYKKSTTKYGWRMTDDRRPMTDGG